jgi:hypothetical protein
MRGDLAPPPGLRRQNLSSTERQAYIVQRGNLSYIVRRNANTWTKGKEQ